MTLPATSARALTALYRYFFRSLCVLSLGIFSSLAFAGQYEVHHFDLEGSKIKIIQPLITNGRALIIAHGSRPFGADLSAEFDYHRSFYQGLLEQGWILASTSYSGNRIIPTQAIRDLGYLKSYLNIQYPEVKEFYAIGSSLGGDSVTLLAESKAAENRPSDNKAAQYAGILSLCPSMFLNVLATNQLNTPTVFMSNQDEIGNVERYIDKLKPDSIKPVVRKVARDGHCRFNDKEITLAWSELMRLKKGESPKPFDTILIANEVRTSSAIFAEDAFETRISRIDKVYGNIISDGVAEDLAKIKIEIGQDFLVQCKEKQFKVRLGSAYSDVFFGRWIAFIDDDSRLMIARNAWNAADSLDCSVNDTIKIIKI